MRKRILTGAESFEELVENGYFYVDKTLFIKELLENKGKATLITRPRRFGKTMNMSMLRSFFDVRADSRALFDGLKITGHKDICDSHMNKYPVVFVTLKNVENDTYEDSLESIRDLVSEICQEKMYLYRSDDLDEFKKKQFYRLCAKESTVTELKSALKFLTACLHAHHKKRVIVLLDEYDAPLNNAAIEGFYDRMLKFMRGFMGSVFKTNDYLEFGVLTGIQRIARESLVSSFNNPKVCGIMNEKFATCFGFTEDEVKDACGMYGLDDTYLEVKRWYDGYRFGGRDMYNPWSITGYLDEKKFDVYWANTGSMAIFQNVYADGDLQLRDDMAGLITGAPVMMSLEGGITYPVDYESSDAFWTMMLNAGYVKPLSGAKTDRFGAELVNTEIKLLFSRYAKKWFGKQRSAVSKAIQGFVGCLLTGDAGGVRDALNNDLLNNPSCHDYNSENSYHMFIFGMLLALSGDYTVYSNPESGKGRSDCLIKPEDKGKHAVVIEFKHDGEKADGLKAEAEKGLMQIEEKAYVHDLKREGYGRIYKYGIAFHKKGCEVAIAAVDR